MSKNPLVSIIMNCHNGEKFLKKSLNSVIKQTYKNWEIIFYDNQSVDNSKEILNSFNNKKIKYFHSKKYLKLYEARNFAIKEAKGKYITFLDTDDWWNKNKLINQILLIEKNNSTLIYTNVWMYNDETKKKYLFCANKEPSGKITQRLLNKYKVGIITVMVKKEIFRKFKFNNQYQIIGDFDFFTKLSINNNFSYIDKPLTFYRMHEKNLSKIKLKVYVKEMAHWINKNNKMFRNLGFSINNQKIFLLKLRIKIFFFKLLNFLGV